MNTQLNIEKEIDNMLLDDIWSLSELLPYRQFSKDVMDIYIGILAKYHGLSGRQMRFLANEHAEVAIAAFCDTFYRWTLISIFMTCKHGSD